MGLISQAWTNLALPARITGALRTLMLANKQLESELEELRAAMATGGTLQCLSTSRCIIDQSPH
jgi:hypothetical protein